MIKKDEGGREGTDRMKRIMMKMTTRTKKKKPRNLFVSFERNDDCRSNLWREKETSRGSRIKLRAQPPSINFRDIPISQSRVPIASESTLIEWSTCPAPRPSV